MEKTCWICNKNMEVSHHRFPNPEVCIACFTNSEKPDPAHLPLKVDGKHCMCHRHAEQKCKVAGCPLSIRPERI